uniref:Uncharacterized protein n=1 Tax=Nicotiana tabacum TaxID=4097 RepID=A0A1S4A2C7_TOBAC|nr:PREDICTED: uncharacterized protein LOC107793025 [Nicotiana tabacum]
MLNNFNITLHCTIWLRSYCKIAYKLSSSSKHPSFDVSYLLAKHQRGGYSKRKRVAAYRGIYKFRGILFGSNPLSSGVRIRSTFESKGSLDWNSGWFYCTNHQSFYLLLQVSLIGKSRQRRQEKGYTKEDLRFYFMLLATNSNLISCKFHALYYPNFRK